MNLTVGYRNACTDELLERDHELRASLYGIEAVSVALHEQRDRLSSADVDQLMLTIASEARRLRVMLAPRVAQRAAFDLADAIRPAVLMARSSGVDVRDSVPNGTWVHGRRDDVAQVMLALLDNARVHAAASPVEVRATTADGSITLFVEDRGPGLSRIDGQLIFRRGHRGAQSSGSGLGLSIARRLMIEQGGSLTVDERPGGGTSFALRLRRSASSASASPARVDREPVVAR